MNRRGISVPVVLLHLIFALSSRPVQADAVETSGHILQYVVPALALGMTGYERDLPGAGQLVTSALVTESLVWTLKLTIDAKRPSGGGRGFPSGHSATAAFGAAFVHRRYGIVPALPLYAGTAFVAWSRVDAGAHRAIDVIAGVAIGVGMSMVIAKPFGRDVNVVPMSVNDGFGAQLVVIY
jgi:membrane-associated phospholipid phosphatase